MPTPEFSATTPFSKTAEAVFADLQSTLDGLSSAEAARRIVVTGPNRLPERLKEPLLKRVLRHFHDVLIYVLLVSAAVTALLGHWVDTGIIVAVVLINGVIGFLQEGKAERALEGIRRMLSVHAQVLRDGVWQEVDAETLVPGDVVRLKSGDRVPADLRLHETLQLRIEESLLTGESVPANKDGVVVSSNAVLGDRRNMAFSGTLVIAGRGIGVVTAIGGATEIGRINRMISEVEKLATPLTVQMNRFGQVLSGVIVGLALLMGLLGWALHDMNTSDLFLAAIGFAVAAIPEGLPAVLTITLALGVQRMAGRNAITRRLTAVETLGSVTVICSDKTGTLTQNEMTVRNTVTRAGMCTISGTGYSPQGAIFGEDGETPVRLSERADLQALLEVMTVCNDSGIAMVENRWQVVGEPTEGALVTLGQKLGFDTQGYARIAVIPFESENKFMATLNHSPAGEQRILMKGAPDRLLDRCATQRGSTGAREPLDRALWEAHMECLSGRGLRVLAAAVATTSQKESLDYGDLEAGLCFVGLVGIIDPPRPEAIEAIRICRRAGIQVKMITGDHAGTAVAIGREMGICDSDFAITGAELERADDARLQEMVRTCHIFARTSPEHKIRLVKALQANGEVTAMTGDGVNDAPALKRADVGVAMGIKGTEATREAADIVLADDNFATIERAVEEGRTIYDNLRKAILFILPTNGAEGLVVLAAVVSGFALPLTPVQILWVNMVTAVTLALAMAFEPSEPGIMERPPRKPGSSIIDGDFLWRIGFVSALLGGATIAVFLLEKANGMDLVTARTITVNTLVAGQVFYLFNIRRIESASFSVTHFLSNRVALLCVGILMMLQLGFVYLPMFQRLFGSTALTPAQWLIPLGVGAAVFLLVEAEKALLRCFRS
jgi:magnesium-transporting ATPase (P-type)